MNSTVAACSDRTQLGYTLGTTAGAPVDLEVRVRTSSCSDEALEREVIVPLVGPFIGPLDSTDGPASPRVWVNDEQLQVDAVDGCLAEVLIDWGDRSNPTSVPVPDCSEGQRTAAPLEHDYEPGTYLQRVTVTSTGEDGADAQVAFVEREVVIE